MKQVVGDQRSEPKRLLLSVREAADVLGIGRSKLYELLASNELAVVRIGRSVRIPVSALEAFVAARIGGEEVPA